MNPLVTVGIPTYSNPEGLRRTLDCITNQSYKDLDILIADNCSPDPRVQEVIKEFKDPRIRNFRHETNIGVDKNYRFVIDIAVGKYFMFAQDDDWWSPDYIKNLVEGLEREPEAPVGACPSRYLGSNGVESEPHPLNNISVYKTVGCGDMGFICMGMWRREAFKRCEVRLPVYVLGGDHMTVAHAIMAYGDPVIVPSEQYVKGYREGRFQICFNNDFWYSFRSWFWLMKVLVLSNQIPAQRKILLPFVAITNLARACAITGVQVVIGMPDNPVKRMVQKRFFGAN